MKNVLKPAAVLIALYLVVYNGSKSGIVITKGAAGVRDVVKTFQGR